MTVNVHEAKTKLSQLMARAESGEDIVIARSGDPAVRLVPVKKAPRKSRLGGLEGLWQVPDDFDTMFEKEIEEMFYGNPDKFK